MTRCGTWWTVAGDSQKFLVVLGLPGGRLSIRWVSGQYAKKTVRRWRMALAGGPFLIVAAWLLPRELRDSFSVMSGIRSLPAEVAAADHHWWLKEAPLDSRWRWAADLQYEHVGLDARVRIVRELVEVDRQGTSGAPVPV